MTKPDNLALRPPAQQFLADAQRITNEGLVDELLVRFADDAVAEWIMDGAADTYRGIDQIRAAATELFDVCHTLGLRVHKTLECEGADTLVFSWTGGFNGGTGQFGTEIWTFRGGLIVRHQMYSYLDVRPSTSPLAALRLTATAPKVVGALLRYRLKHRR
ncbi:nuclear transport factor 2 family protein [Gordonia sp. NPDC003424]